MCLIIDDFYLNSSKIERALLKILGCKLQIMNLVLYLSYHVGFEENVIFCSQVDFLNIFDNNMVSVTCSR